MFSYGFSHTKLKREETIITLTMICHTSQRKDLVLKLQLQFVSFDKRALQFVS